MKRDYSIGEKEDITYFIGAEVEKTPALGKKTLFVTGLQRIEEVELLAVKNNCRHIFFGANHSFSMGSKFDLNRWIELIEYFLKKNYLCSLDISIGLVEKFSHTNLHNYSNFIPQIRVPIPYVEKWNDNTMIKIDDIDFNKTNPGIWTHRLNNLTDNKTFTEWELYKKDEVIK